MTINPEILTARHIARVLSIPSALDVTTFFKGKIERPKVSFNSHNDHRIVMSLSLLSTLFDIEISGAEAVEKSYPNFFNELEKVGVKIEYETE